MLYLKIYGRAFLRTKFSCNIYNRVSVVSVSLKPIVDFATIPCSYVAFWKGRKEDYVDATCVFFEISLAIQKLKTLNSRNFHVAPKKVGQHASLLVYWCQEDTLACLSSTMFVRNVARYVSLFKQYAVHAQSRKWRQTSFHCSVSCRWGYYIRKNNFRNFMCFKLSTKTEAFPVKAKVSVTPKRVQPAVEPSKQST